MNNLDIFCGKSEKIDSYARQYIKYLNNILNKIDFSIFNDVEAILEDARKNNNTIFVAGNGGSATTASTMANDLGFDIIKKTGTNLPFRFLSLTDNNSVITAISNDVGYDNVFINQLKIHFRQGDKLIVISASGNSPNLINAVEWIKKNGGQTVALLGFSGGQLKDLCDVAVHFQTAKGEYGPVEDAHLVVNHILAHWFQKKLKI